MEPDPSDDDIESGLRAAAPDRWADLWAAVDALTEDDKTADWSDGYATYSPTVRRVLDLLPELGVVRPFNWVYWDGVARYRGGVGLDAAPVADAVRLATAIVRADRFNEGTIEATLRDGTFEAMLHRLRRWRDE